MITRQMWVGFGFLCSMLLAAAAGGRGRFGIETAQAQEGGIQIAGATPISPLVLSRGCNQIVTDAPNGVPLAGLATLAQPQSAVISIWRFNNTTKTYQAGYFAGSSAPVDFTLMGSGGGARSTESYMICVSTGTEMLP